MADMVDLSDLPDIDATFNTLGQQIEDGREKLVSARAEAATLRQENLLLTERIESRDATISELNRKLEEIKKEVG